MRVAVAGGSGLIGWHAVKALLSKGHKVRILARNQPSPSLGLLGRNDVEFFQIDLYKATQNELLSALDNCNALIQASGADYRTLVSGRWWSRTVARDYFFECNVESDRRLFGAALETGTVKAAVLVTSCYAGVFPEMEKDHPYVASRVAQERVVRSLCSGKIRLVVLQPPLVVGSVPGRTCPIESLPKLCHFAARFKLPLLAPVSGGAALMSASALGNAICGGLERDDVEGTFLVGDENLQWEDFIRRFGTSSNRVYAVLPEWLLTVLFWLIDMICILMNLQSGLRGVPYARILMSNMFVDAARSKRILGYKGGDLDEAIRSCVASQETQEMKQDIQSYPDFIAMVE